MNQDDDHDSAEDQATESNDLSSSIDTTGTVTVTMPPSISNTGYGTLSVNPAGNLTGAANNITSNYITSTAYVMGSGLYLGTPARTSAITIHGSDASQSEIVRLNLDGTVVWANGIKIDEAARAFARVLTDGAELRAGITQAVKLRMRDSVFNDIIALARERGSLTADDLTFMLEASKMVEKLKGPNE